MARSSKKVQEPTDAERTLLYKLMYDSALFQAHPIVVTNVRNTVGELLEALGRPDLAELWGDPEKLLQQSK